MEGMIILACTCENKFMDETLGKGLRWHNVNAKGLAACVCCCPNAQRNRMNPAAQIDANKLMGHGVIPAGLPRKLKTVPK